LVVWFYFIFTQQDPHTIKMASSILYKFSSGLTFEALPLPGTAARLFDVKKAIVKAKRLDVGGMDFELEVSDASTNQQYVDESMLLPRGTRLIVRRVGAARGQGFVSRMQRAEAGIAVQAPSSSYANAPSGYYTIESNRDDEDEFVSTNQGQDDRELAALRAATDTALNPIGGTSRPSASSSFRAAGSGPPQQQRPGANFPPKQPGFRLNADPELRAQEQMPKKRATGIPRTFLNLSAPPLTDGTKTDGDLDNVPRLQPNALGFEELVHRGGGQSENTSGTKKDLEYALKLTATTIPEHLQCGICHGVVKNAMLLPWDLEGRTACETCIRDALTQSGFRCPLTGNEGVSPDDLLANMPLRKAAESFVQSVMEKMEEINKQQVDEPDQDDEADISAKEFDADTGEKGVIVSKKTRSSFKRFDDDDDPFGGGNDDFGGDVFDVSADKVDEEETEETADVGDAAEDKEATAQVEATEKNKSTPLDSEEKDKTKETPKIDTEQQFKDSSLSEEQEKESRREARKQRAVPTGYAMGPAVGATGPSTPSEPEKPDDHQTDFRGRGRGGRSWDRGGYRGGRGEGRPGGHRGGRGRYDNYDGGRGYPPQRFGGGEERGSDVGFEVSKLLVRYSSQTFLALPSPWIIYPPEGKFLYSK
jgi:protein MPE1